MVNALVGTGVPVLGLGRPFLLLLPLFDRCGMTMVRLTTRVMIMMMLTVLMTCIACLWCCLVVRRVVWVVVVPLWADPVDLPLPFTLSSGSVLRIIAGFRGLV